MTDPGQTAPLAPPAGSPPRSALALAQRSILVATCAMAVAAVLGWNALAGHADRPAPAANGGLDPVAIARSDLEVSALHWLSIRLDGTRYRLDFAPMLVDAAALGSVRYGVDQTVPDRVMPLPSNRHLWPLPPDRFGDHVVLLPAGSRFVSIRVTFSDGRSSPVLLYPLARDPA